ncbi:MAG: hypothetical protein V7749_16050 [Cocleimonas sp.]
MSDGAALIRPTFYSPSILVLLLGKVPSRRAENTMLERSDDDPKGDVFID